jgi:hypothetical protein
MQEVGSHLVEQMDLCTYITLSINSRPLVPAARRKQDPEDAAIVLRGWLRQIVGCWRGCARRLGCGWRCSCWMRFGPSVRWLPDGVGDERPEFVRNLGRGSLREEKDSRCPTAAYKR